MDITRYCEPAQLNWATLPSLATLFGTDENEESVRFQAQLDRDPDHVTYNNVDSAIDDVRQRGYPKAWSLKVEQVRISGTSHTYPTIIVAVRPEYVHLTLWRAVDATQMDTLTEFLGLRPREPHRLAPGRPRTAFVAHRFDEMGAKLADKLARFLGLFDFEVTTGRGYSPQSVAEKVRTRIENQEVIFVVRTVGEDDTWLIQEAALGQVSGKPLVILKSSDAEFKPGMLADHEYIPFEGTSIESTFVPILEGLRELGYRLSDKSAE